MHVAAESLFVILFSSRRRTGNAPYSPLFSIASVRGLRFGQASDRRRTVFPLRRTTGWPLRLCSPAVRADQMAGRQVPLIDVFSTGRAVSGCARILPPAGASVVSVVVSAAAAARTLNRDAAHLESSVPGLG